MKQRRVLVWSLFMFALLAISPMSFFFQKLAVNPLTASTYHVSLAPMQGATDWENVTLQAVFDYSDVVDIWWWGNPSNYSAPPFGPLYNWTLNGTIDSWVMGDNLPYSEMNVSVNALYSAIEVEAFFNYTMTHFVEFDAISQAAINFNDYANQLNWTFAGNLTSTVNLLNMTIRLVENGTQFLMNGFSPQGIAGNLTDCHVRLEWSAMNTGVWMQYRIANVTEVHEETFVFRLGRALGSSTPVTLNGSGTVIIIGPPNYVITAATPASLFVNWTIPFNPTAPLLYSLPEEINYDFDILIEYYQGGGFILAGIGSFIAIALASLGAAIGIGYAGNAMIQAISRKPETFSKGMISVVLAEALSIYGLLAAFMIIMRMETLMGMAEGVMALAAGLAIGFAGIGAGVGIASCGSALCWSLQYRPEAFSKALVSVVLAEALSIYGLLVSFIIIMRIGTTVTLAMAWISVAAALTVGIGGLFAGLAIGWSGAAMTGSVERRTEVFSKAMVSVVLAEALAIYCLLVAFMLLMA
jgi:V/A-type H+-transporting ATPase subunit K